MLGTGTVARMCPSPSTRSRFAVPLGELGEDSSGTQTPGWGCSLGTPCPLPQGPSTAPGPVSPTAPSPAVATWHPWAQRGWEPRARRGGHGPGIARAEVVPQGVPSRPCPAAGSGPTAAPRGTGVPWLPCARAPEPDPHPRPVPGAPCTRCCCHRRPAGGQDPDPLCRHRPRPVLIATGANPCRCRSRPAAPRPFHPGTGQGAPQAHLALGRSGGSSAPCPRSHPPAPLWSHVPIIALCGDPLPVVRRLPRRVPRPHIADPQDRTRTPSPPGLR